MMLEALQAELVLAADQFKAQADDAITDELPAHAALYASVEIVVASAAALVGTARRVLEEAEAA